MGEVWWSDQAESDLESIDLAVRDEIRRNAEKILHQNPPCPYPADEDADDAGVMWRCCTNHEQERQIEAGWLPEEADDGAQAWDYFLIYRSLNPGPGFEVLAVRSIQQIANWWIRMNGEY